MMEQKHEMFGSTEGCRAWDEVLVARSALHQVQLNVACPVAASTRFAPPGIAKIQVRNHMNTVCLRLYSCINIYIYIHVLYIYIHRYIFHSITCPYMPICGNIWYMGLLVCIKYLFS